MSATPNIGTYQISDVTSELEGMAHGTTLNQVVDLFGVYNRAARRVMEDVDPQETKIVASFGKVYNGVFDYPWFTDTKGNKIIDFYPQANRTLQDNYGQQYNKDFDLLKDYSITPDFTPRYSGAVRTLRLNAANLVTGIQVNAADNINDNGTWVNGGNAGAPANNQLFFTTGVAGSVQTNLALTNIAGSTGYLENSTMTAVNLTNNYNNNADNFFQVYLPQASAFTSVSFRIGSSPANYYELTGITTTALGNAFSTGWNLIKVPFPSMTTTGTPNLAAINYIRATFTYDGSLQNQVLINQFYSRIGVLFNMEYYSKYLFRDATTGVFQEKATDNKNYVNLDTDAYNIFLFAAGAEMIQQTQGLDALFYDGGQFETRYQAAIATYKNKYKSETTKPQTIYYWQPKSNYNNYVNLGFGYGNL